MLISAKHMAILREHVRAESVHDIDALIGGMTPNCFNDIVGAPEPFVGPSKQRNAIASASDATSRVASPVTVFRALMEEL